MYIGARKLTSINTIINMCFYFFVLILLETKINYAELVIASVIFVTYYIFNVFSLEKGKYTINDFINSFMVNLLFMSLIYLLKISTHSLGLFMYNFFFQNIFKILLYYFFVRNRNVIIVGDNEEAQELEEMLRDRDLYNIVAKISLKDISKLDEICQRKIITKIIITEELEEEEHIITLLNEKLKGIKIDSFLNFFEKIEEKVPVKSIDEKWLLFGNGYNLLHENFNVRIKRVFDLLMAFAIGLVTLPVMLVSALIIKLESKGSVIYSQKRVGLGNKEFNIYKFRSMCQDAEKNGAQWAQKNDSRVTKFGKIMRKTRIDELPQLWNVIKGDMTFVGPRPERMVFIKELEKEIPFYNTRHYVKPGLTGWAQVKYPYGASVEDAFHKLEYDLYYIKNQSLAMDVIILLKTIKTVVFRKGQ